MEKNRKKSGGEGVRALCAAALLFGVASLVLVFLCLPLGLVSGLCALALSAALPARRRALPLELPLVAFVLALLRTLHR